MDTGRSFPFWNLEFKLILASKSLSRRALLEAAGLPFSMESPRVDERQIERSWATSPKRADDLPLHLARAKALEVSGRFPDSLCLGADQVLSLNGEVFHKPKSLEEAQTHIARLSGKTHELKSAFALARKGKIVDEGWDTARLTMRELDASAIYRYARAAGEAILSSVGAYQLEAFGVHLFERVEGDHTTILGLPMLRLLARLRSVGALTI